KGRTFGDTEFVIGHSGSTVPERSGVALSFCGRLAYHCGFSDQAHLTRVLRSKLGVTPTQLRKTNNLE
ncbi:AraC family transcriptional regulator, partial [Pseudomonas veronii]|uniref:AraC family transcriptional regulator n=1 Tax=Pseudomonas veronii TaxID=76761 RepID=UPI001EE733E5